MHSGDFGYCRFGGYLNTKVKATGVFRVEQVDGKWWFVDPDGHLFFSTSATGMGSGGGDSRLNGREDYFAAMPPNEANPSPLRRPETGFYTWNVFGVTEPIRPPDGLTSRSADSSPGHEHDR